MPNEQLTTASNAARRLGVEVYTLRRWCDWHKAHLSLSANPGEGQSRRLTEQDIAVLQHVRALRNNGLQTDAINAQLGTLTFAVVEDLLPDSPAVDTILVQTGLQAVQEGQQATSTALQVIEALSTVLSPLEARINRLEARRFDVQSFAFGVIVGLLFVLVFIGIAWIVVR